MKLLRVSWGDTERLCAKLALKVRKDFRPDIIVGVSRGGLVPARLLSDMLGVDDVYIMRVRHYTGIGKHAKKPVIVQDIPISVAGKRVLVADDVADSGGSLAVVRNRLRGAKELRIATLHMKPHSKFEPDYYVAETNAWIAYPWEKSEIRRENRR